MGFTLVGKYAILVWSLATLGFVAAVPNADFDPTLVKWTRTPTVPDSREADGPPECTPTSIPEGYDTAVIKIASQDDIDVLSNCTEIYGDIWVQGDELETISVTGIENIWGTFKVFNSTKLKKISAPTLIGSSIDFSLLNLPLLDTLDIPSWKYCSHALFWESLPLLDSTNALELCAEDDVSLISTGLRSLQAFNFTHLSGMNIGPVTIKDNPDLGDISLNHGYIAGLSIANNSASCSVSLDELVYAKNDFSISGAVAVEMPRLTTLEGSLELTNNPSLGAFDAQNLSYIFGSVVFRDNGKLENLSLPTLSYIGNFEHIVGSLLIEGNSNLQSIYLPKLFGVADGTNISGTLSSILLSAIDDDFIFRSSFAINTTVSDFDCSPFDKTNDRTLKQKTIHVPSYTYSCHAFAPGSKKDIAKHWKQKPKFPTAGKIAVIVIASLLGLLVVVILIRWARRRWQRKPNGGKRSGVPLGSTGRKRSSYQPDLDEPGEMPFKDSRSHDVQEAGSETTQEVGDAPLTVPLRHSHADDGEVSSLMSGANDSIHSFRREPSTRQRSLLGKIWYGREPVPIPA